MKMKEIEPGGACMTGAPFIRQRMNRNSYNQDKTFEIFTRR